MAPFGAFAVEVDPGLHFSFLSLKDIHLSEYIGKLPTGPINTKRLIALTTLAQQGHDKTTANDDDLEYPLYKRTPKLLVNRFLLTLHVILDSSELPLHLCFAHLTIV